MEGILGCTDRCGLSYSVIQCLNGRIYACIWLGQLRTFNDSAGSRHLWLCRVLETPLQGSCASIRAWLSDLSCPRGEHVAHCVSLKGWSMGRSLEDANQKCRGHSVRLATSSIQPVLLSESVRVQSLFLWNHVPQYWTISRLPKGVS